MSDMMKFLNISVNSTKITCSDRQFEQPWQGGSLEWSDYVVINAPAIARCNIGIPFLRNMNSIESNENVLGTVQASICFLPKYVW